MMTDWHEKSIDAPARNGKVGSAGPGGAQPVVRAANLFQQPICMRTMSGEPCTAGSSPHPAEEDS